MLMGMAFCSCPHILLRKLMSSMLLLVLVIGFIEANSESALQALECRRITYQALNVKAVTWTLASNPIL